MLTFVPIPLPVKHLGQVSQKWRKRGFLIYHLQAMQMYLIEMEICICLWHMQGSSEKDKRDEDGCDEVVLCICIYLPSAHNLYLVQTHIWLGGAAEYSPIRWLWSFDTALFISRYLRKPHMIIRRTHLLQVSKEAHKSHFEVSSNSARGCVHASETDTVYWFCCVPLFPFHFHFLSSNACHTFTYIYYLSFARSLL